MKAMIVYYTKTGHTKQAAEAIARGLEENGVASTLKDVSEVRGGEVAAIDIFVAGTPTYGNTRYKSAAKPVAAFLESLDRDGLSGKTAGAFSVNAGFGAEKVVKAMEGQLAGLGARVVSGGPAVKAGAPLSLWKGPDPSPADVARCVEFGRRLAQTASA